MAKRNLFLMSGVPGSGKSFFADKIHSKQTPRLPNVICSADAFFTAENNPGQVEEYKYDPRRIAQAHAACFEKFILSAGSLSCDIIIDNTSITMWERKQYVLTGQALGLNVEVHAFKCHTIDDVKHCIARNVHGVPKETIARMAVDHDTRPVNGETVITWTITHTPIELPEMPF